MMFEGSPRSGASAHSTSRAMYETPPIPLRSMTARAARPMAGARWRVCIGTSTATLTIPRSHGCGRMRRGHATHDGVVEHDHVHARAQEAVKCLRGRLDD